MENYNTIAILKFLIGKRKPLFLTFVIAFALSAFFSSPLFITSDYKSEFSAYPTNLIPFGKESGVEQLFEFFNSEEIKLALGKRFHLYKHYGIDSSDKKARREFNKTYNALVQIKFTRNQSIEGAVIDNSPEFAQAMANGMVDEVNNLIRKRKKEKYAEQAQLYKKQLQNKKNEIDSLESKLKFMRVNYGLLNIKSQSKSLGKIVGNKNLPESDNTVLNNFKEHSGEFAILQNEFTYELENYKNLKQAFDKNTTDFNAHLTYMTIISYPDLPDKKNAPNRTVIVLIVTLSSLLLHALALLIKRTRFN